MGDVRNVKEESGIKDIMTELGVYGPWQDNHIGKE